MSSATIVGREPPTVCAILHTANAATTSSRKKSPAGEGGAKTCATVLSAGKQPHGRATLLLRTPDSERGQHRQKGSPAS